MPHKKTIHNRGHRNGGNRNKQDNYYHQSQQRHHHQGQHRGQHQQQQRQHQHRNVNSGPSQKHDINNPKCDKCGSFYHTQQQCTANGLDLKRWAHFLSTETPHACTYCGRLDHMPVNCHKNPEVAKQIANRTKNNSSNNKSGFCSFCKKHTTHTLDACQEMEKWKARADISIIRGLSQLPYCILCGAKHAWLECQTGWAERIANQQRDRSKAILMDWLEKPVDVDVSERDPIFCGFCESFGQHNTLNCHTTAEIYKQDEDQFLLDRFGSALASGYTIDGKKKHSKMYKPIVEKKCRMCRTTLPKATKMDDQPEHEIIVACSNLRCKQLNLIPVESGDESGSPGVDNTWSGRNGSWGGINITTREQAAAQLLAAGAKEWWPFLGGHNATQDSKGQPYYEGPQCMTKAASQAFGTNKYDHNGWWHFNDPGNFQPMFPPATLHFTSTDKAVREEPNCAINHTRAGLIPFCLCCGLFGTVVDDDEDIVMAQTGPSNEGNLAGAGAGIVSFENPLYQLGGYNPLGENHYIPGFKCWCGVVFGAEPQVAWVKQRALAPQPKMQLDLRRWKPLQR